MEDVPTSIPLIFPPVCSPTKTHTKGLWRLTFPFARSGDHGDKLDAKKKQLNLASL